MRTMNAHRLTIFQDVKIEVAVFMMKNEESRRWLSRMRAWKEKEEYDMCSFLPQGLSVAWSDFHKAMWSGTSSTVAVLGALITRTCEF